MSADVLSLIGILIGLAFLMFFAFKGYHVFLVAPFAAVVVGVISRMSVTEVLTNTYATKFVTFAKSYWLILLFGAVFGRLMGESGAARTIAIKLAGLTKSMPRNKQKVFAVLSIVLCYTILVYGGISTFVVMFLMVAIARELFQELDVPWHLYTCSVLGSGVYVAGMLPGSPSVPNIAPVSYLGTTAMAAPALGFVATIIALVFGISYIVFIVKRCEKRGEHFIDTGAEIMQVEMKEGGEATMNLFIALLPSVVLIVVMNVLRQKAVIALVWACIAAVICYRKHFSIPIIKDAIKAGGINAANACLAACAVVGFGGVVAAVPGYTMIMNGLASMNLPVAFEIVIAVNIACGVTGSASGGIAICLENMSQKFLASGLNPELIHRMMSMSACGLDTMPHNSVVVNTLAVTHLSYKDGYRHYFALSVLTPIITSVISGLLVSIGLFT